MTGLRLNSAKPDTARLATYERAAEYKQKREGSGGPVAVALQAWLCNKDYKSVDGNLQIDRHGQLIWHPFAFCKPPTYLTVSPQIASDWPLVAPHTYRLAHEHVCGRSTLGCRRSRPQALRPPLRARAPPPRRSLAPAVRMNFTADALAASPPRREDDGLSRAHYTDEVSLSALPHAVPKAERRPPRHPTRCPAPAVCAPRLRTAAGMLL